MIFYFVKEANMYKQNNEKTTHTLHLTQNVLKNLLPIDRILSVAHFADEFDAYNLSKILDLTPEYVEDELQFITQHINSELQEYKRMNNCDLYDVDEQLIKDAFISLFNQI